MDSKQKKKINTTASGVQLPGHHNGRLQNPVQKVVDVKYDPKPQKQALKDRQTTQSHE